MGMSLVAANNVAAEIRMLEGDLAYTRPGTPRAAAIAVELEILRARESVKFAAAGLEQSKRVQMTVDVTREGGARGYFFMLADSHKSITYYSERLTSARARLARAYAAR